MGIYEEGFLEFLEEGMSAEKKGHYRAAVSNYYKAISEACSFLIQSKTGKMPSNHSEIFMFLRINFPQVHSFLAPAFDIYTKAYDSTIEKDELNIVKNVIKKIATRPEISEKIRKSAERI